MNWKAKVPSFITIPLLIAIVVGSLVLFGWIKSYVEGPNLALTSLYHPKPVPVKVEKVKWLTKIKTEQVQVPVEVIREVPVKEAARLDKDFGIKLDLLHAENKELSTVLTVPKAAYGGEMAVIVNTGTGKTDGIFKPNGAPFIEFGGIKEIGLDYNPLSSAGTVYYRQDLVRVGPVIVNGKAFVSGSSRAGGGSLPSYGVSIGGAVRF